MKIMYIKKILVISALASLVACANQETFASKIKERGAAYTEIADSWDSGDAMIKEGNELVSKGNQDYKKGKSLMSDGENKIRSGEKLVQRGESMKASAETQYLQLRKTPAFTQPN